MATVYLGSVVNPTGQLHGLPVMLVNQGSVVDGHRQNVGASLTSALEHSSGVTRRLSLTSGTFQQAQAQMDKGRAYATLVIPATLTRSALLAAGIRTPGAAPPATAVVQLAENTRLGTLGVNLASGVLRPAMDQISPQIGSHLSALATPATKENPILASQLARPVALTTTT
jgi:hypothetical protein